MGTQTTRPAAPDEKKDESPKTDRIPLSADVPKDETDVEPPPKSWPG